VTGRAGGADPVTADAPVPPEPFAGAPGALVLFSDVACPWATVVVLRLRAARAALGCEATVPIIHLAHPLELLHRHALPRRIVDAEIPACAAATPDFGWSLWQGRLDEYPASSLLAVEAVQAARRQSESAAEELDLALRRALFVRSRCISLRHEVLDAADTCPALDLDRLTDDLDHGVARGALTRQAAAARAGAATCSGDVVTPDGAGWCNPGIVTSWLGQGPPRGVAVLVRDDPDVCLELVAHAASGEVSVRPPGRPATPSTPACSALPALGGVGPEEDLDPGQGARLDQLGRVGAGGGVEQGPVQ
jgi:predicted DsbA family dithiol-disulfide isomerase